MGEFVAAAPTDVSLGLTAAADASAAAVLVPASAQRLGGIKRLTFSNQK